MDTIEVEREVFDALIERVDFLHKTVKALYDELRDKKLSDWLNTKQTSVFPCYYTENQSKPMAWASFLFALHTPTELFLVGVERLPLDHSTMTVLNGSRLGKEFSANAINERFNNPANAHINSPDVVAPTVVRFFLRCIRRRNSSSSGLNDCPCWNRSSPGIGRS